MIARQRPLVIGIALLLGALGGCATGQISQTASQAAAVNGANGQAGPVAIRDAEFVYPQDGHRYPSGSSAPLKMIIVNTSETEDRLVTAQSPVAASVRLEGTTTIPGRGAVRVVPPNAPAQASATSASRTPAPVSPSTTLPSTTLPSTTASKPGGTTEESAVGELTIVLENLTEDIRPGKPVQVVLVFEQAGEVVLFVPIATPDEPRGESTP